MVKFGTAAVAPAASCTTEHSHCTMSSAKSLVKNLKPGQELNGMAITADLKEMYRGREHLLITYGLLCLHGCGGCHALNPHNSSSTVHSHTRTEQSHSHRVHMHTRTCIHARARMHLPMRPLLHSVVPSTQHTAVRRLTPWVFAS